MRFPSVRYAVSVSLVCGFRESFLDGDTVLFDASSLVDGVVFYESCSLVSVKNVEHFLYGLCLLIFPILVVRFIDPCVFQKGVYNDGATYMWDSFNPRQDIVSYEHGFLVLVSALRFELLHRNTCYSVGHTSVGIQRS